MGEELGKIEKPSVDQFAKGRRLLFVPLLLKGGEVTKEYSEKLDKYWSQVEQQIDNLVSKLGGIQRLFHELVYLTGKEGLDELKGINEPTYVIAEKLVDKGASFEAVEDKELLTELSDWGRCLSSGLENQKVFTEVFNSYEEALTKRNDYITKKIDETLKPDEIGILFFSERNQIKFPQDVEVFYIAPPALDEINRWERESKNPPVPEDKGDSKEQS